MGIFEFNNYRACIKASVVANSTVRNYKTRLAASAGCQLSYLSQVLNSKVELTPDHAAGIAEFWGLSPEETRYFLNLVYLSRAGTPRLRNRIEAELTELKEKNSRVAERIGTKQGLTEKEQAVYYASWIYAAIHVQLSIKNTQTAESIASELRLSFSTVERALKLLESIGLAVYGNGEWKPLKQQIHLPNESPFVASFHIHWRERIIQKLHEGMESDLHYTGAHAISRSDAAKIRQGLVDSIAQARKIIDPSPEEAVYLFSLDFFPLGT